MWLNENQLSLNREKTNYIPLTIANRNIPNFHTFNITVIGDMREVENIKYFVINIDVNIKWNQRAEYLTKN